MFVHPQFDPIAIHLGSFGIHWYGLMYLVGFGSAWLLGRWRITRGKSHLTQRDLEDLIFYGVLGVVAGGRLGYVLFYKPAYYLAHPLEITFLWEGGMSFHGGLLGVLVMMFWLAHSRGYKFFEVADFVAPLIPLALAAGRLGNFINGELWGRVADPSLPWAMVFQGAGELPRHPSQVYQFLMEGLLLFVLLWLYARKQRKEGQVAAAFLLGYGVFRFIAEFFREPDAHLGLLSLGMSMGQWLCVPMIVGGVALWFWAAERAKERAKQLA